ncbi:MAG: thioesterase family protein [Acidimicrobiia bacterium]|nr:thioesterase family protein [Acidimicrobiia bacterium]
MITTREFLAIERASPERWRMPVDAHTTGGRRGSLFGGVGLAAAIIALEEATERPTIWATGQYVSTLEPPCVLELDVSLPAHGRSITQGQVRGHLDDREIITVLGANGSRREELHGVWEHRPRAAPPNRCETVIREFGHHSIHQHVDIRMARGMFSFTGTGTPSGDGNTLLWARMPEVRHDRAAIALMADYNASSVGNAFGRIVYATSLDNTIRFATALDRSDHDPDTDWVLCENRVEFVGSGFANATCLIWSDGGALLATASQSMALSLPEPDTLPHVTEK